MPRAIWLKALQRVRVEEHRPAHGVGMAELRHDGRPVLDAQFGERCDDGRLPFLRRRHFKRRDRQRVDVTDVRLWRSLDLQVDEIRLALAMVQRPTDESGGVFAQFLLRQDLFRPGNMHAFPIFFFAGPHFQTV